MARWCAWHETEWGMLPKYQRAIFPTWRAHIYQVSHCPKINESCPNINEPYSQRHAYLITLDQRAILPISISHIPISTSHTESCPNISEPYSQRDTQIYSRSTSHTPNINESCPNINEPYSPYLRVLSQYLRAIFPMSMSVFPISTSHTPIVTRRSIHHRSARHIPNINESVPNINESVPNINEPYS